MSEGVHKPLPQFPGGPDPELPIPRDPVHGVDLGTCAAIAAQLSARRDPGAPSSARFQLDEARWTGIEQTWMLRIATAALKGDLSFSQEYDSAFSAARDALHGAEVSLATYAAVTARIESGQPASEAMRAEGCGPGLRAGAAQVGGQDRGLGGGPHAEAQAKLSEERAKLGS
ncbi:MAG: hypothetical protein R3B70_39055 [Polyangiaceae bacterium]